MAAAAADCPACGRYIGRTTVCPYCDVDIPVPLWLRLLRIGAWVLASGGLLLTWVVATGMSGDDYRSTSNAHSQQLTEDGSPYLVNSNAMAFPQRLTEDGSPYLMNSDEMGRASRPRRAATAEPGNSGTNRTGHLLNPISRIYTVLKPHLHWMLWGGITFMLLAEPLQPVSAGKAGWRRCLAANRPTGMAALVFTLAGLLGFILFNAATFTPGLALLGLVPAAGIGALPLLHDVRRRNALGIILLPLACELSGLSPALVALLNLH